MTVGQINGQYRQICGIWLDGKMKNKKIRKKFSENNFYHRLKFSEKIFLQKSRKDSVVAGCCKGGGGLLRRLIINTGTKRTCRTYIARVFAYNTRG